MTVGHAMTPLREEMIPLQEYLDWRVCEAFGLAPKGISYRPHESDHCPRGGRSFERITPRRTFVREQGRPLTIEEAEVPPVNVASSGLDAAWSEYEESIRQTPHLRLIEQALYKRQWRDTDELATRGEEAPRVRSLRSLAGDASKGRGWGAIVEVLAGRGECDGDALMASMVRVHAVPYLAALRFTEEGMAKYSLWRLTWDLQRAEDRGERVCDIVVPPAFASDDCRALEHWRLRGKLDVPKERFISYPGCEGEDGSPLVGWAGWDQPSVRRCWLASTTSGSRKVGMPHA